ncbi:MAG: hypothetical protein ACK50K_14280, partial [Betaproteobacteria bacterium]
ADSYAGCELPKYEADDFLDIFSTCVRQLRPAPEEPPISLDNRAGATAALAHSQKTKKTKTSASCLGSSQPA